MDFRPAVTPELTQNTERSISGYGGLHWFPEEHNGLFSPAVRRRYSPVHFRRKENRYSHALEYFTRRQLWLIFFGIIDVYLLLWFGDILFDYGCYGLIMVAFRKWSPKWLLIAAGVCFVHGGA